MFNMEKNIIFSTIVDDEESYRNDFEEECECNNIDPEDCDFYEWLADDISRWLGDEKMNLDIECGSIIALGDLGFWNGRRTTVIPLSRNNVNAIFDIARHYNGINDEEYYCDEEDVCCSLYHHDGTHYFTFVELTDMSAEDFVERLNSGEDVEKLINEHTTSLRPRVAKVYGW